MTAGIGVIVGGSSVLFSGIITGVIVGVNVGVIAGIEVSVGDTLES